MSVGDELSDRKKQILKAVIDMYIEAGEPIGSKALVSGTAIGCSSATIRNEMAELEEMGYLEHPHTSAGRVPTPLGYRFYVEELMNRYSLTARELSVLNNLQSVRIAELDRILSTASRITAAVTNYTGVAVKPRKRSRLITCYKTAFIDKRNFLISFIMDDNTVNSKYLNVDYDVSEDVLNRVCGVLNNNMANKTSEMITLSVIMKMRAELGEYDTLVTPIISAVYEVIGDTGTDDIHIEGVDHLLQYPEYSDTSNLRELLSLFDNKQDLVSLVEKSDTDEVSVYIGGEEKAPLVTNSSIIVRTLNHNGKVVGGIGVIGPSRMEYSRVVAVVDYIADTINKLLEGAPKPKANSPNDENGDKKNE